MFFPWWQVAGYNYFNTKRNTNTKTSRSVWQNVSRFSKKKSEFNMTVVRRDYHWSVKYWRPFHCPLWTLKPTAPLAPANLHPYSQPSSPVCRSGRWLTDASPGSSVCCWVPSGFSSARWCWPGASATHPLTYPETRGGGGRYENSCITNS